MLSTGWCFFSWISSEHQNALQLDNSIELSQGWQPYAFLIKPRRKPPCWRSSATPSCGGRLTNWYGRVTRNFARFFPAHCSLFPRQNEKSRYFYLFIYFRSLVFFFGKCYGSAGVLRIVLRCSFLSVEFFECQFIWLVYYQGSQFNSKNCGMRAYYNFILLLLLLLLFVLLT